MTNEKPNISESIATAQLVKQVLTAWNGQNKYADKFFYKYNDEYYFKEVSPGRNRAIYLFGHLIAVNDDLFRVLGIGDRLYPELDEAFITNPDKAINDIPSINELKTYWEEVNKKLMDHFDKMTVQEWMDRHTLISQEDFEKEPHRNRLNVLLTRTTHQAYHLGQLYLLEEKQD